MEPLGELAAAGDNTVHYHWSLMYHLMPLLSWLVIVPFLLFPENRKLAAGVILIPWLAMLGLLQVVNFVFTFGDTPLSALGLGWALVWLLAGRMRNISRLLAFFVALLIMAGSVLWLALASSGFSARGVVEMVIQAILLAVGLLAFTLAAAWCRRQYRAWKMTLGILLASMILALLAVIPFAVIFLISIWSELDGIADLAGGILAFLAGVAMALLITGVAVALPALLFFWTVHLSPFYRQRLAEVLRIPGVLPAQPEPQAPHE